MAVSERPTSWFEDMTELIGKFEPVLLDCVREELERLGTEGGKSRFAKVALELGSTFQRAACGGGRVDDEIVSAASSMHAMVATADRELEISLKALRVGTVMLRSGRVYLP
jgi:rRNA-processing protein FCF1